MASNRRVQFSQNDAQVIPILNEVIWADDYIAARSSSWQSDALDRMRFDRRIKELGQLLHEIHTSQLVDYKNASKS